MRQKNRMKTNGRTAGRIQLWENLFLMILVLYPLRHIHWGIDFWDTGYNYANFTYMGLEHMDSMWLFSTYLSNVVGNLLTKLPLGDCLVGMNLYTGLLVSLMAVLGYWFCTRRLRMPGPIAFVGEMAAVSLCWCPTALLYNYLTYLLFMLCVILLYEGLTKEKTAYLFIAGVCLGINVLVRFSNIPEAAMIVAVWAYAFIVERERRDGRAFARGMRHTLWCLLGYLAALFVLLGYIQLRYGLEAYAEGIRRLFAMTDNATDYKAASMLMGMVYPYVENLYWIVRIFVIAGVGMVFSALAGAVSRHFGAACGKKWYKLLRGAEYVVGVLLGAAMLYWLYKRGFCSNQFESYDSILRPGILFLMLTLGIALLRIFAGGSSKEERLISGMLFLQVLLTCIGSNNGVYPSLNNLFLAAPYTLWQCSCFIVRIKERSIKGVRLQPFAVKCILSAFLLLFLVQTGMFGARFVFAEATGVREADTVVENNEVLAGVKMNAKRAEWMTEISAYVEENSLQGRELLIYGQLPALSYYLKMPAAFNPWSDLRSYSAEQMQKDMEKLCSAVEQGEKELPVVLLEHSCGEYLSGKKDEQMEQDKKWQLIVEFLQSYGYQQTFENEKFILLESAAADHNFLLHKKGTAAYKSCSPFFFASLIKSSGQSEHCTSPI